jgi:hypothetical protein
MAKILKSHFSIIVVHIFVVLFLYGLLYGFGFINRLPDNKNLLAWDGFWYRDIAFNGYKYKENAICNLAFFPLFPIVWKILSVDALLMSIINFLIFLTGFLTLFKGLKVRNDLLLVLISTPSLIFCALPYSEALFFLSNVLIIIGLLRGSRDLQFFGFFLVSFSRSVSIIFIPAIIVVEVLLLKPGTSVKSIVRNIFLNICACLFGLFTTVLIQFFTTGKWFYFIEVQQYWQRKWQLPSFPFTTIDPERIIGLDSTAFMVGFFAICITFVFLLVRLKIFKTDYFDSKPGMLKAFMISLMYLSATTILDVFFTYDSGGKTNIWSVNRHIFATPYYIFVFYWLTSREVSWKKISIFIFPAFVIGIFITGVFAETNSLIYYLILGMGTILFISSEKHKVYSYGLYTVNTFMQVCLFHDFLTHKWIG